MLSAHPREREAWSGSRLTRAAEYRADPRDARRTDNSAFESK
jgi:hypothetical protein